MIDTIPAIPQIPCPKPIPPTSISSGNNSYKPCPIPGQPPFNPNDPNCSAELRYRIAGPAPQYGVPPPFVPRPGISHGGCPGRPGPPGPPGKSGQAGAAGFVFHGRLNSGITSIVPPPNTGCDDLSNAPGPCSGTPSGTGYCPTIIGGCYAVPPGTQLNDAYNGTTLSPVVYDSRFRPGTVFYDATNPTDVTTITVSVSSAQCSSTHPVIFSVIPSDHIRIVDANNSNNYVDYNIIEVEQVNRQGVVFSVSYVRAVGSLPENGPIYVSFGGLIGQELDAASPTDGTYRLVNSTSDNITSNLVNISEITISYSSFYNIQGSRRGVKVIFSADVIAPGLCQFQFVCPLSLNIEGEVMFTGAMLSPSNAIAPAVGQTFSRADSLVQVFWTAPEAGTYNGSLYGSWISALLT